jgi:hypothetical protein
MMAAKASAAGIRRMEFLSKAASFEGDPPRITRHGANLRSNRRFLKTISATAAARQGPYLAGRPAGG